MEAVEIARRVAAQLHDDAVARGKDPWAPLAFATAEAARRGIDIETTAPGAAVLDGGRATYVPGDRLILIENAGSDFERAFLIAHEIGHVELGDDPEAGPARAIDPARPAEPAPVGLDRVVDYGPRQRREVQMDLFAREFLLPRSVARRLHISDEMTATAIAEKLGAPFAVVAQQLLDALLLPPIEPSDEESREFPLHPLQQAAAEHRGRAYLLEAGPGTGKTQTLTARAEDLLAQGTDPRRILLLTFSNKAAGEMAARIARKHKEAAAAMWIGTFHAFGLDFIRRFHAELGLPEDPQMLDRTEAVELLEAEFPRLGLTHYHNIYDPTQIIDDILKAISRAKDEVVGPERYSELAEEMRKAALADEKAGVPDAAERLEAAAKAAEVAKVYLTYEGLKRTAHRVDFGDLVSLPVQLLERDDAIRSHMKGLYDHVLVDEYQDVNRSSVRLLKALRGDGDNLWAVGDAKQSIYRFRGASSFNMARFDKQDFPDAGRGRLKCNYRSVEEIVTAFSNFAVTMTVGDADSGLDADRGPSRMAPELRTVTLPDPQKVAVADAIVQMDKEGFAFRDQAVLCTGNEKLSEIAQDLERLGVPVLFLGSLFEREEIKGLLSFLSLLTDRRAMGLVRLGCWDEFALSLPDVAAVLDHLRRREAEPLAWLAERQNIPGLSNAGQESITALAAALDGFESDALPWPVLATMLLDRTRLAAHLCESTDVIDRTRGMAIWQFMNFLRVQPGGQGLPITRLLNRVRRLVRLGDDRDLRQLPAAAQGINAVRLMTIHGAKGLEFPVVHVPGLNADTMPRRPQTPPCPAPDGMIEGGQGSAVEIFRAGHAEEQECLFFVALSRARDRLFLYAPTQKRNGHNRAISPFLDRLGSVLQRSHVDPDRALPPPAAAGNITLTVEGGLRFAAQQIALFESCARRFFYTHILQVGGRRTMTPFMQMHEAVRIAFKAIIAGSVDADDPAAIERAIDQALAAQELADHGYLSHYRSFALAMIAYFVDRRRGHRPEAATALSLAVGAEQVLVHPDDILIRPDGGRVLRRVSTGHQRSYEADDVGAAAFLLAAQQAFPEATVELVYLSDQHIHPLTLSTTKLNNRRKTLEDILGHVRAGRFPASPSHRTCPKCPAFFICGSTPPGTLTRKF